MSKSLFKLMMPAALCALAAAPALLPAQQDEDTPVLRGIEKVSRMMQHIRQSYIGSVDEGRLVEAAIRGMLNQLDPHSTYFGPIQARQLRTEQEGEYYGVGLSIGIRDDEVTVISPMEDGPAWRLGIRSGDIITHVDGAATGTLDLDECSRRLRGPEGTEVTVTVQREGLEGSFDVTITRTKISLHSVPYSFHVADGIGYLRLTHFARTSSAEVSAAVEQLRLEGLRGLILDLRANPGGDLDEAVAVTNLFLDEGLILYTQGVDESTREDYSADADDTAWRGPMVVLMNRGSASGAEIVAGALQDQDRAIIAGGTSWGKGLVQGVFGLQHGAALALTTARYYTPSGRLIQRPYEVGQFDQYYNPEDESGLDQMQQARTSLGRIVYGGRGIAPDEHIPDPQFTPLTQQLLLSGRLFDFITAYLAEHTGTSAGFRADDAVMSELRSYLENNSFEVDDEHWRQDYESLKIRVTLGTVTRLAGAEAGYRAVLPLDRQVLRAIELMGRADELLQRKLAAEAD